MKRGLFLITLIFVFFEVNYGQWYRQYANPFNANLNDIGYFSENKILTVGHPGNIFLSEDAGINWQVIECPVNNSLNGVAVIDYQTAVIVGSSSTILKTADGGYTWNEIEVGSFGNFEDVSFIDAQNGFIAGSSGAFMKTGDGGETWEGQNVNSDYDYHGHHFFSENLGWLVGRTSGTSPNGLIMHTNNGGLSWVTDTLLSGYSLFNDVCFTSQYVGWAVGDRLFKTENAGQSWVHQPIWYSAYYSINFTSPLEGWITKSAGEILHTTDGGLNWIDVTSNTSELLKNIVFFDSEQGAAVGWNGAYLVTTDGGSTWQNKGDCNQSLLSVHFVNNNHGWTAGIKGKIFHTINGGQTWELQESGFGNPIWGLWFIDQNIGWASANPYVLHTVDGGENWSIQLTDSTMYSYFMDICFSDPNHGWIARSNSDGYVYHTSDGGQNWESVYVGGESFRKVVFSDNLHGWLLNWDSKVFYTNDGGQNWSFTDLNLPTYYEVLSMSFVDNHNGWLTAYSEPYTRLYHTTDGGENWSIQSYINVENALVYFINEHEGWAAGMDTDAVAYTNDGGETWVTQFDDYFGYFYDMQVTEDYKGWVVGDGAVIFHTQNGGGVVVEEKEKTLPKQEAIVEFYPNPFSSTFSLSPKYPIKENVTLHWLDGEGKMIFSQEFPSGILNEEKIHIQNLHLQTGVVFYILQSKSFLQSGKLIHH